MGSASARALAAVTAAAVVVGLPPRPGAWAEVVHGFSGSAPAPPLDTVAVLLAGAGLWSTAGWVLIALALGRIAALPGAAGAAGRLLLQICVPRVLRGLVLGGVAGGLLLGPAVAASAAPGPAWPTTPAAAATTPGPGPAWPTSPAPAGPSGTAPTGPTGPAPAPPPPALPTTPATPATPATPTAPPATPTAPPAPTAPTPQMPATSSDPADVVVAPGDSLWSIAAGALNGPGAPPTAAKIAAAWPAWYAANRAAVGPDPGLLHPGTHLTAPTTDGSTS